MLNKGHMTKDHMTNDLEGQLSHVTCKNFRWESCDQKVRWPKSHVTRLWSKMIEFWKRSKISSGDIQPKSLGPLNGDHALEPYISHTFWTMHRSGTLWIIIYDSMGPDYLPVKLMNKPFIISSRQKSQFPLQI